MDRLRVDQRRVDLRSRERQEWAVNGWIEDINIQARRAVSLGHAF